MRLLNYIKALKKLTGNRERVGEQEQNGYRIMGYKTDTEWISNGYGTVTDHKKGKKKHSVQCKLAN